MSDPEKTPPFYEEFRVEADEILTEMGHLLREIERQPRAVERVCADRDTSNFSFEQGGRDGQ